MNRRQLYSLFLVAPLLLGAAPAAVPQEAPPAAVAPQQEPQEPRDQDILVPTATGPDRATKSEVERIQSLEQKPTSALTTAFLVGDAKSGTVLSASHAEEVLPLASTSKLMSLYVVLEELETKGVDLETKISIDEKSAALGGSSFKLQAGEMVSLKKLIEASLIVSGNDAITALGTYVAGSQEAFIQMVNQRMKALGFQGHMVNPHGLTDYAKMDYNQMRTVDLFTLTRLLISRYPEVLTMSAKSALIDNERNFSEINTNPLLGIVGGVDGLKTGYTNAAGRCLVATALKPGKDHETEDMRLILITMGSPNNWARFVAARRLAVEHLARYEQRRVLDESVTLGNLEVKDAVPESLPVYPSQELSLLVDRKNPPEVSLRLKPQTPPLPKDTSVGEVVVTKGGKVLLRTDVLIHEPLRQRHILSRARHLLKEVFEELMAPQKKAPQ